LPLARRGARRGARPAPRPQRRARRRREKTRGRGRAQDRGQGQESGGGRQGRERKEEGAKAERAGEEGWRRAGRSVRVGSCERKPAYQGVNAAGSPERRRQFEVYLKERLASASTDEMRCKLLPAFPSSYVKLAAPAPQNNWRLPPASS